MTGIFSSISRTPLIAAFFFGLLGLTACRESNQLASLGSEACEQASVLISEIQGDGDRSPLVGEKLIVSGVVTMIGDPEGLFIESLQADDNPATSEGLYLRSATLAANLRPGAHITVQGVVSEAGDGKDTLTSLDQIDAWQSCASNIPLPEQNFNLPMNLRELESLEAMSLRWTEPLVVTDTYRHLRGDLRLSRNSILPNPTEVARPGADARRQLALNRRSSIQAKLQEPVRTVLPAGASLLSGSGVMGHDGRSLRLLLRDDLNVLEPRTYRNAAPADGDIRVASFNLHNYFNGDGKGGGFPTPRGAETAAEFNQQRRRLSAAIEEIKPHVLAAMELENDGFGPFSAAADFITDLESATGSNWLVVFPGDPEHPEQGIGDDAITVGLFYDDSVIDLAGPARLLEVEPFGVSSRIPLAQAFRDRRSGEEFTVIVNHLKSKGSCPDSGRDSDLRDGQGCWNQARTRAAKALARWAMQLADATSGGKVLVVGDMNAYRMEEPISALVNAGFFDLTAPSGPRPSYTFFYGGEAGTLDYAFATPDLLPHVTAARVLNINSPWPPGMELPQLWLRSSDHDPVLVDLGFNKD